MRTIIKIGMVASLLFVPLPAQSHTGGQPPKHPVKASSNILKIDHLIATPSRPNYDRDVLVPLRAAQAAKAKVDAKTKAAEDARQAARDAATPAAAQVSVPQTLSVPAAPVVVGDAKAFIYMHESGNRTNAINPSSGACGLGQALPCSKMPCTLSDYACQDAFFTTYMLGRYGSWEAARSFWIAHNWW